MEEASRTTARPPLRSFTMLRSLLRPMVAILVLSSAAPVRAAGDGVPTAPTAAVAAAWAKEGAQPVPSSKALNLMMGSYAALQALDMTTTIQARNAGAREVNPVMAGGYGQAATMKALMSVGTLGAGKLMAKKNSKAALITMIALNVASAAIVANNMKNAQPLNRR
jgi:hypothetical protein